MVDAVVLCEKVGVIFGSLRLLRKLWSGPAVVPSKDPTTKLTEGARALFLLRVEDGLRTAFLGPFLPVFGLGRAV